MDDGDSPLHGHKLAGFLCIVLSAPHGPPALNAACTPFKDGEAAGFRSDGGVILVPPANAGESAPAAQQVLAGDGGPRKRRRRSGMPGGSGGGDVVRKIVALSESKCVEVEARVVGVWVRDGERRALVLVDVYLPIAAWSGWQFPKAGAVAASLFQHLSCNWKTRSSLFTIDYTDKMSILVDEDSIWNPARCHVLGCKMHSNVSVPNKDQLFELYEIFKSIPSVGKRGSVHPSNIVPANLSVDSGIWDLSDDLLTNILSSLSPRDLVKVAATCRHLRSLAVSIMPCMKLKLFPHQQAAVEWMLQRECDPEVLPHPLYLDFVTEDGFHFYINIMTGELITGIAPMVTDFRGGMFCDEPGLGKTITALSLILKTQGSLPDPPNEVDIVWCSHNSEQRCGYYECKHEDLIPGSFLSTGKRTHVKHERRGWSFLDSIAPKSCTVGSSSHVQKNDGLMEPILPLELLGSPSANSFFDTKVMRCTRTMNHVKKNLMGVFDQESVSASKKRSNRNAYGRTYVPKVIPSCGGSEKQKKLQKSVSTYPEDDETWVQCDACRKWRKLLQGSIPDASSAWFCSMNSDTFHQSCSVPEESWDCRRTITYLPGFSEKGTLQGKHQNISFFENVLKEHFLLINAETRKALMWLANLSIEKLAEMETIGLRRPVIATSFGSDEDSPGYYKIFQAFGLTKKVIRGAVRWFYPYALNGNLTFDVTALRVALSKPLDTFKLYLSRATLIVVPANLVDHWKTQIQRHVRPGQLRVFVWTDQKTPLAHNLAWDYDIVITTFNRLSAEWSPHRRSIMRQIHWLRIMLDEGHTLGSSLNLTNKLQMAISLVATCRWILTGTPTPKTPSSQVANLQSMLKFLHEEAYGHDQKAWEGGILKPFEAQMEEGRSRLLALLQRCMISARKSDLHNIPPCKKKVTFLDFTGEHAQSYNELVVTIRRNILMADWNDPSHVESLLNPKQWKFRSNTIRNVRLSCCVAGHIKVTDAGHDIQETMDILVQQGLDPQCEEYAFIRCSLLNGSNCFRCKEWCRLPVITPCRHLLCLDCVALDSVKCTFPGCGNPYEMQSPEIMTRPENPNPKWPVPKDLIELQPSYKQDDWAPDWHATSSSKVAYLVGRLKDLKDNKNDGCFLVENGGGDSREHLEGAIDHLVRDYDKHLEKVIIFSQFLEHIHVIEEQLTTAGIKYTGLYSPMHSSSKLKSLMFFQHDPNCMALIMDGSAALGLDLSFVTHVFLMEPIWDRSVEEQVISRAHRMGATRAVNVETLAMRGTIEEQMIQFLQNDNDYRRTVKRVFCQSDIERPRGHRTLHDFAESNYLARLSFVHTGAGI